MNSSVNVKAQAYLLIASLALGFAVSLWLPNEILKSSLGPITTYLVPMFFVQIGMELRHELTSGYFQLRRNILAPGVAALFGATLPALFFLAIVGFDQGAWSIPTATDITLGLAVLAIAPKVFKSSLRARFLALATIDDIIGLILLLLLFSGELQPTYIFASAACLAGIWLIERLQTRLAILSYVLAAGAIYWGAQSGIQTSLIGVGIGLLLRGNAEFKMLQRFSGWIVLPVFACFCTALAGQTLSFGISPLVFFAVLLRPLGKLIGIAIGGSVADRLVNKVGDIQQWAMVGLLGGIGLAVSFLLASLAYGSSPSSYAAAVLGTLLAALFSALSFLALATWKGRQGHRVEKSL